MIVILKILSIFSALAIVFCCAVPASAAEDLPVYGTSLNDEDYNWTVLETCSAEQFRKIRPNHLVLNEDGVAVLKEGVTTFPATSCFGIVEDRPYPLKLVIECNAKVIVNYRVNGGLNGKNFVGSGIYYGSVLRCQLQCCDDFYFTKAILYVGTKKTLPERFPAIPAALTFILSCFSSMFVLITNNPLLCLGLSFFAIGGAIGLFNKIKG